MSYLDITDLPEEVTEDIYLFVHDEWSFMSISQHPDMDDYTRVAGPLSVTFKIKDNDEIINDVVASLRKSMQTVRAEAEVKCNAIEEKIQSYLALPNLEKDDD